MKKGYVITNPCACIHNQTPAMCYGYTCPNLGPPGKVYSRQVRRQAMHDFQRDERKAQETWLCRRLAQPHRYDHRNVLLVIAP